MQTFKNFAEVLQKHVYKTRCIEQDKEHKFLQTLYLLLLWSLSPVNNLALRFSL